MKRIEVLAPAKINLFLKILNKRQDGYHNIETVFEKISLCDKIKIQEHPRKEIIIASNSKYISSLGKNNIIYKAVCLIKKKLKIDRGLSVFLEKNIPTAAGLGGGSSDAAAILKGLNRLWRLDLSSKDLTDFSKTLGSDLPLFISNGSFLIGNDRGDQVVKVRGTDNLKLWHILIVPDFGISTAYAYSLFDSCHPSKKRPYKSRDLSKKLKLTIPGYGVNIITHALSNRDVSLLNYYSYNSFESIILRRFTRLARLKKALDTLSNNCCYLSGSGPSLFITLSKRKEAECLVKKIDKAAKRCRCFLVNTF